MVGNMEEPGNKPSLRRRRSQDSNRKAWHMKLLSLECSEEENRDTNTNRMVPRVQTRWAGGFCKALGFLSIV